jgi:DNA-binding transcriptional ArsR family regulator
MKKHQALAALAALAQDNRLDVFRLLVEAGQEGMPAGAVADALKLAPNNLTFHFDRLREAGLVTDTMNALLGYLTENCCRGHADQCAPAASAGSTKVRQKEPVS